ncbi:MAG: 5-methyltetrahydropteroyltriglutamate--homocysteine S-methyltransferase [Opitutaceae bacterium]|nr:5-methyltetrahydropteroyltriglutamate--homocysteine S-methyltransferase [Cytophagales bacterium]
MISHNLGFPRVGNHRELKKANENYWAGKIPYYELEAVAKQIKETNWITQKNAGIDLIPCNDFSFYDHVLDMTLTVGAIPTRFFPLTQRRNFLESDLYFAMARGYQKEDMDITAMEMTKWFDTNYHYLVPEFQKNQQFNLFSEKVLNDFIEAKRVLGATPKAVLIGPVSYLLLGKEKEEGFHRLELLERLLPVYKKILQKLSDNGAKWIQFDEPFLVMDLTELERLSFNKTYQLLRKDFPNLKLMVATYFECTGNNIQTAIALPIDALHIDLTRCSAQLSDILQSTFIASGTSLSLGLVDGRNIWKNNYSESLAYIQQATEILGADRIMIAPSCSLLHVPCDLDLELNEKVLTPDIKSWMAFAKQKLDEVVTLKNLSNSELSTEGINKLKINEQAILSRKSSPLIHKKHVKDRLNGIKKEDAQRKSTFEVRQKIQSEVLNLPLLPTTTIGSFPQTEDVRIARSRYKKGEISTNEYEDFIKTEVEKAVRWQEKVGLDVLVHGEYERNDMVEYFGELLDGYTFSENGWVQSYGSRCVKPPIIFGDIERKKAMTVRWTTYAQSLTQKWMKGMLTGPVTILQWSFVRDDQPRKDTCRQIAFAIRDEVLDLEKAGIHIIQIDEPAIREGLPLRKENWQSYLNWAVECFRISASGVEDKTQIHTHMCYSEFNDIIQNIADMDADVITIETSRSQMELLDAFVDFKYPNEIGPGVYDIHSPRVPTKEEMIYLLNKALNVLPVRNLWVNPDCGLKTRKWPETEAAVKNMVEAAAHIRQQILELV